MRKHCVGVCTGNVLKCESELLGTLKGRSRKAEANAGRHEGEQNPQDEVCDHDVESRDNVGPTQQEQDRE